MRVLLMGMVLLLSLIPLAPRSLAVPDPEPVSYGFSDPDDVGALLDYRLPDWSYRAWTLNADLSGNAGTHTYPTTTNISNAFRSNLGTTFRQNWESDLNNRSIHGSLGGNYTREHRGYETGERSGHTLRGAYTLNASQDHHVNGGPVYLTGGMRLQGEYSENIIDYSPGEENDFEGYSRSSNRVVWAGPGVGRLRNVEPLIRAQRLSERLAALGKGRLNRDAVLRVARALAREGGYAQVFSRPDRHFWDEVLQPVLEQCGSLSPYEMHYLADALVEDVGWRQQGWAVQAVYNWQETRAVAPLDENSSRQRYPELRATWYSNLSLEHQIGLSGLYRYVWAESSYDLEQAQAQLQLSYLWLLTDRHRLEADLGMNLYSRVSDGSRTRRLDMECRFYSRLEDRVSLLARVQGQYFWDRSWTSDEDFAWTFNYSLGLVYTLDRWLL